MLASMRVMMGDHHSQSSTPAKPKHDAPVLISGKREDWKTFQAQLGQLFLIAAPPTDVDKIMFSISRLGGAAAFKYMEKCIPSFKLHAEERPLLLSNLNAFFKAMSKTFGVTNAHVLAESQFRTLKQRGSALDYTNKFTNFTADSKWNDAAMISQYRFGLRENLQESIAKYEEPETFAEFSQLAMPPLQVQRI
ncbi:Retrotransposon-derived protein peg10 [Mortierella sp. GBA39]|nr:Retrotransposon-derived protein peg10 [Mortierella sp. GBA39]